MRAFWSFALIACAGCAEENVCVEQLEEVAGCDVRFEDEICDTQRGQCAIACYSTVDCGVLRGYFFDDEPAPEALNRCWAKCIEPFRCDGGKTTIDARFRCDGEADCSDGADEQRCDYFECDDGQLVGKDARCDEWEECNDGSDEKGCE